MSNKILLLQPRTAAKANYSNGAGEEQRWVPWFALFLAPIAQVYGLSVELVDCRTKPNWRELTGQLRVGDLLAVSVITGNSIRDAVEASSIARQAGARVAWGGPHSSLFARETLDQAPVDAVAAGRGYGPMNAIADAVSSGCWPPPRTAGLLTRDAAPSLSSERKVSPPIVPAPALDLIYDWDPYLNSDVALASRTINYVASEGCARFCTFCSEPIMSNRIWSPHDIAVSVSSISELCERSNANAIKLHDANFFHDRQRAMIFAERFKAKVDLPWAATIHPADLELYSSSELCWLARNGLARVLVGLESPNKDITKLAGKQYRPENAQRLASRLADAGIRGMFTFIVGWPGALESHYGETIAAAEAMREVWPEHQAKIHFLEPWPGTPIFRLLERRGMTRPRNLVEWSNIDYYQAKHMEIHDPNQVQAIQDANRRLSPYVDA